jgi:hypothetical protein
VRIAETIAAQPLSVFRQSFTRDFHAVSAALRACFVVLSIDARGALAQLHGNTSLSRTVFFSMCWCIRDGVHLDSRVHAAIEVISNSGGQHGQESEEGEEGKERSEEEREEDQEGRQEEVTSRLQKIAGGLMPARHTSPRYGLLTKSRFQQVALVDERGCRRDIRSTAGSHFAWASPFRTTVRQKKQVFFVRCGSLIRNFTGDLSPK